MTEEHHVDDMQHLRDACKAVEENSLYTAQAHFEMTARATMARTAFLIAPALVAALVGALVAMGYSPLLGVAGALAGFLAAVASVLGVDKPPMRHQHAANLFTALRHEARSLHQTFWKELDRTTLVTEVRRLEERYNVLVQTLDPTDASAFESARKKIKEKVFEMDFQQQGAVGALGSTKRLLPEEGSRDKSG